MSKGYLFSIVMSVYNVEPYIEEAVESLIDQTIGFSDNVQIVFVNDGSTDGSGEVCKAYRDKFPGNIVYIEQENAGLAAARNTGLQHAEGRFVNFFDPDDILSPNVLEEVSGFFGSHELEIDMVAIPLVYFEGQKGLHGKYKTMGKKNRVIDLLGEPSNFILSSASCFYKQNCFDGLRFDESLSIGEDADLNFQLFRKKPRFGYVCEKDVVYHYRRRLAGGSNVDALREGKSSKPIFDNLASLNRLLTNACGQVRAYEKEFIAYQLRSVLRDARKEAFDSKDSYDQFIDRCKELVSSFDEEFVLRQSKIIDTNARKQLFLLLKGTSFKSCIDAGIIGMSQFDIMLRDVQVSRESFVLDLTFHNFGCAFDVIAVGVDGEVCQPAKGKDFSSSFDARYGEFALDQTHHRQFILPYVLGGYSLYFVNERTGIVEAPRRLCAMSKPPLMSLGSALGMSRFGKKLFIKKSRLEIMEDAKGSIARGLDTARSIRKNSHVTAWLRPFSRDKKRFVVVMDRPNKAGDNGQALYEHIMKYGSRRLRSCTYFVLDKKSEDYSSLPCKAHVLQPRSLKHKLVILNARIVYFSHNARQFYLPFAHKGKYYADLLDYEFVWLQHGITKDDIARAANRLHTEDDFVVASTEEERDSLFDPTYFYEHSQILLTGLPRYDKLQSKPKRLITIAPTWRSSLCGKILPSGFHEAVPGFTESEYYAAFKELLTSERLKSLLLKYDFTCQFLCHMGFACYEEHFEELASERVTILHQASANYARIFEESSIFITDYSSTAFDFAYLSKPLIYFQFDELTQYDPGWFSYKENGLGPITETVDQTIDMIEHYLANDCRVDDYYAKRIDSFFAYRDKNNCKRLLDVTLPDDLK